MTEIKRPIVTEKSIHQAESRTYTFEVSKKATKSEIAKAVEAVYGVKIAGVRIQNIIGKKIRRRTGPGKERDWKKAFVSVQTGQVIKDFAFAKEDKPEDKKL